MGTLRIVEACGQIPSCVVSCATHRRIRAPPQRARPARSSSNHLTRTSQPAFRSDVIDLPHKSRSRDPDVAKLSHRVAMTCCHNPQMLFSSLAGAACENEL